MALTPSQLTSLKAFITADPTLSAIPQSADGAFAVADALNLPATPDFVVWASSVSTNEIMQNGFGWDRVDNLTVGKARIWDFMTRAGTLNPTRPNVRAGFIACFSVAADLATRQAIFNHCVRPASRAEKLFATGSGTAPTDQGIGPATMVFEGRLVYQDILSAWAAA